MDLTGLNILLTFECNSQCRHCSYQAGPRRRGHVQADDACRWLEQLGKFHPIRSVTVHGGEPFLYFDDLRAIIGKARELNIEQRWVITNGFWADGPGKTQARLRALKNAGLTAITFSVDAFHQEFVPFERIKQGTVSAVQAGLETHVDSYFLPPSRAHHEHDAETRRYLNILGTIAGLLFSENPLRFEGRASSLAPRRILRDIPDGKCRLPSWLGGDLKNPGTVEVDYCGNVTLCPGLCIGTINANNIVEIISNYDYRRHPIIAILAAQGPIGLYDLARSYGYTNAQGFVDECHLCYEMRKFLVARYPRYLAPAGCYDNG